MSHYEHLADLAAKSEHKGGTCRPIPEDCSCKNNGDFCPACEREAENWEYFESEPVDVPRDAMHKLIEQFISDMYYMGEKMKNFGGEAMSTISVEAPFVDCPVCNGFGLVNAKLEDVEDGYYNYCQACDGTGKIHPAYIRHDVTGTALLKVLALVGLVLAGIILYWVRG